MAYLGNAPKGNLLTMNSSQFSGDNSETNFTLSQTVTNTNEVEVFVGNVRQDPHSAYTISGGTTLAFTAAPPTGTNNIYVSTNKVDLDLFLMSQSKHSIVIPSSFNWWGAWLGKSSKSIVIRPSNDQFSNFNVNNKDFWPKDWLVV